MALTCYPLQIVKEAGTVETVELACIPAGGLFKFPGETIYYIKLKTEEKLLLLKL